MHRDKHILLASHHLGKKIAKANTEKAHLPWQKPQQRRKNLPPEAEILRSSKCFFWQDESPKIKLTYWKHHQMFPTADILLCGFGQGHT